MKEVIAEAGVAFHNFDEAARHISLAAQAGCDAIKFQIYDDKTIESSPIKWQKHLKEIQVGESEAWMLMKYGEAAGIEVFFTPMFVDAIEWLEELGVKRYKVREKDNMNDELLLRLSETNKQVYVSRNDWPFKQRNFHTVYVDKHRPTRFTEVGFYGCPPSHTHKTDIQCKKYNMGKHKCHDIRHYDIQPSRLAMFFYDGYSCHCDKILAPFIALDLVDYVEVHTTLDVNDKTLPDWEYSHSYTDMKSLWRKAGWLNIVHREGHGKFEVL